MDEALDRISSLPDDVLTHILSFASAKEVVQTCILSKRWRNVWASVPVLEFRLDEFLENYSRTKEDDDPKNELHAKNLKFDRFVVGVLNNRGQSRLDTIMYHWDYVSFSCEPSMKWLDHAVLLKPTVIRVCIGNLLQLDEFNIPDSVFLCESLQNLELSIRTNGTTIIKPKSISLPSLGTMKLKGLCLDDDFAQNLFLGCPSLESLNLEICQIDIPEISSNVLKKLTLDECWQVQHMRICCPCLVSLFISSSMNSIRVISLVNMASLVNAEIDLYGSDGEEDIVDLPDLSILCGLSNATRLKLTLERDLKEQWKKDICKCSVFKNLKSLEIGSWNINDDYDLVACFLEHSPVLQELSFHLFYCDVADAQEEPRQRSFFQLKYLDMVKIICGKNENLASKLIILLGRHVMTIGNVIIT